MTYPTGPRPRTWADFWPLLLGVLLGACLFLFLLVSVGGSSIAFLLAAALLALSGWLQYLWWGRRMMRHETAQSPDEQAAGYLEHDKENPMAEFTLMLNEQERTELLQLLEHSLKETRVEVHRTHTPGYRENVQLEEQVLRNLLDKIRGYGV